MRQSNEYLRWVVLFLFVLLFQIMLFSRHQWYPTANSFGKAMFLPANQSEPIFNVAGLPEEKSDALKNRAVQSTEINASIVVAQDKLFAPTSGHLSLHLYRDLPCADTCEERKNDTMACRCAAIKEIMDHLASEQSDEKSPDLYIVPMDFLTTLAHNSSDYTEQVLAFVNNITMGYPYLHYGGSNHVFLCLLPGCDKIMAEVINSHPLGRDARAIWVGVDSDVRELRETWPCPNRVVSISADLLGRSDFCHKHTPIDLAKKLKNVLEEAIALNNGANRWACSRRKWSFDLDSFDGHQVRGCLLVERHKLCVAGLPKCGTSTLIYLLRRMNGIKNWDGPNANQHNEKNGLVWVHSEGNYTKYKQVMSDPSWVKIIMTREPTERFFSAYMDRVFRRHEINTIHYHAKGIPSINWVAQYLEYLQKKNKICRVDIHYRPGYCFQDLGRIRYDYVGRVDNMYNDLKEILSQLGLWEKYCTSGWGSETGGLMEWRGHNIGVGPKPNVKFSPETLKIIQKLYKDDFGLWSFPWPGNSSRWLG